MAKAKKGANIGVWLVVGLLLVGMIGFGSAGLSTSSNRLATVGDRTVTIPEYTSALRNQIDRFSQQIGMPVTFAQIEPMGLPQAILGQVITEKVLDGETERLGISAGDARVRARVEATPGFQALDGSFDRDAYRFSLERQGMTERAYEATLRDEMARALLQGSVVRGIDAPDAYAEALLGFAGERRSFTFASVGTSDLPAAVLLPDEAAQQAYYDAHPDDYMAPEIRKVTYVWLTPEMLSDSIEVGDEELQALYQERIADYVQEERRLVERIVYPDAAAAEAAMARITSGEADFETLVTDRGLQLSEADMGDVGRSELGEAGDAVFAAEPGDVVGPLMSSLGPALFRMNAVLAAQETTFDEAREELRAEIATVRARRAIADQIESINDLMAGGALLEDLDANTELQIGTLDWSDGMTDGPAAYDEVRASIATAETGAYPTLETLADGGIFALRLDSITAPALQTLDAVRPQVLADATAAAAAEQVAALATQHAVALADGGDFADLGLAPQTMASQLRRDFVEGTPPGFMDLVFSMAQGDITTLPAETGTLIVRLDTIAAYDPADPAMVAQRSDIVDRAAQGMAEDIYGAFARVLQSQTDIAVDDRTVQAVHQQLR